MPAVALDLPPPLAEHVRALRTRLGSWRRALPPEITVAGSSGLGELTFDWREAEQVFGTLGTLAAETPPIPLRFTPVERFPGTGIFYFAPAEREPLWELHGRLARSGLRFLPTPYPFTPHCTIADFHDPPDELVRELLSIEVPPFEAVLETLSLYALDERILRGDAAGCTLLFQTALGGVAAA